MAELLTAEAHELTAKLAYRFWEQRGRPLALRKWIGSQPKRPWPRHNEIRNWSFRCTESAWKQTRDRLIPVDQQIKGSSN
jgi:hypothetical protein